MIGYISSFISFILCTFVYVRMVKREDPPTLGKKSVVPVVLGLVSTVVIVVLAIFLKLFFREFTVTNPVLKSLFSAFIGAGFTEELGKLLFALIAVAIVRPRSVYAYSLMFIGVGFGFTLLEEFAYGGGNNLLTLARLPDFALHMVFGMIMGVNLGLARFKGKHGKSGAMNVIAALVLPVLWHTVFDAATVDNAGIEAENEIAIIIALLVGLVTTVLQFILLIRFKKKSKEYCQMVF
jgi:RsiW-degrading membrane proteinase PrsW (M82 family)